jgi:hypothetical protein
MVYKSKLSNTGKKLLTQIYTDSNNTKKPNKNCIKQLIHNLFTSKYDIELEEIAKNMHGSSLKLYEKIFDFIKIKNYNRTAIYNIIILILTNGETTLTHHLVKYNIGFYLNIAIKAMKNNDHQTAIIIKAALESKHIANINIKYNKTMIKKIKLLNETYGNYNEQYVPHIIIAIKKYRQQHFIPSTLALNMVLNREFVKDRKYTVTTNSNRNSINYKFFDICSVKNKQYKNTPYKLCQIYKTDPLSLSITRIFVENNSKLNKNDQIDKLLNKFNYLINHQINLKYK